MRLLLLSLLLSFNLLGFESYNYVNKNYKITSKQELKHDYFSKISTHFYAQEIKYFNSFDGLKIAYRIFKVKNAKVNIVISSGRTEGMLKYQEFIYDLNRNGYSVYISDHRGQGNSQRLLKDTQIGHVIKFENYVKDLHQFVINFVPKDKKRVLIGHSMGGAIASLYVEEYPQDFTMLALSSPMHQPDLVGNSFGNLACELIEKRKHDIDRYAIGQKSYDDSTTPFEKNILTHSKLRYEITKIAFDIEPQTKVGGPSVRWVSEACSGSAKSIANASKIKIPVLLLQAAEDKVVNLEPQEKFCENVGKLCQGYSIKGAYHELFVEKDSIRKRVMTALLSFIESH